MEARVAGRQPVAVTDQAGSLHQAIDGAAQKLKRSLDSTLGKLGEHKRTTPPIPSSDDES
jgi:ribosome-associated translation inhibitor RaiA